MSKAEDLAEKLYPQKEHVAFGPFPCEEPNVIDDNKPYRIGFIAGYKQAEEDLIDKTLAFLKKRLYKDGYIGIIDLCDDYIKVMKDE